MTIKLLTEHHLKFLGLTGGYAGSSESTLVKMPHCWKSHVAAQLYFSVQIFTRESDIVMASIEASQLTHCIICYIMDQSNWLHR